MEVQTSRSIADLSETRQFNLARRVRVNHPSYFLVQHSLFPSLYPFGSLLLLSLLGISRIVKQRGEADASVPKLRKSGCGWISGVEVRRRVVRRKQDE